MPNKDNPNKRSIYLGLRFNHTSCKGKYLLKIAQRKQYDVYQVKHRVNSFELAVEKLEILNYLKKNKKSA